MGSWTHDGGFKEEATVTLRKSPEILIHGVPAKISGSLYHVHIGCQTATWEAWDELVNQVSIIRRAL